MADKTGDELRSVLEALRVAKRQNDLQLAAQQLEVGRVAAAVRLGEVDAGQVTAAEEKLADLEAEAKRLKGAEHELVNRVVAADQAEKEAVEAAARARVQEIRRKAKKEVVDVERHLAGMHDALERLRVLHDAGKQDAALLGLPLGPFTFRLNSIQLRVGAVLGTPWVPPGRRELTLLSLLGLDSK